jgi:glucose 1-dehydrogenase
MKGLKGRNVLVTGGSSGIGQAIAVRFGQEGANVAINYHGSRDGAEETEALIRAGYDRCVDALRECGVEVSLVRADVGDEDEVERMIDRATDELGPLDVLVNNAGIQIAADSHLAEVEEFDRVLRVNLRGAFLASRGVLRRWVEAEARGCIINVSSVHEVIPKPRFAGYSASKGGMRNLTRTLALEYAGHGIRVNAVGPGATITPMNDAWQDDPEKRAEVESHIPLGRAGTSEEMAAAVAFLASDEAAYVTGQTLFVDGGLTLYPDFRTSWSSE